MRILMLGNSFTYFNDMPQMLARISGAEVVANTRGGATLAEQLNPKTKLGSKVAELMDKEPWNYIILQEMSNGPVTHKSSFLNSVHRLCKKIRSIGAVPVLYATWAYRPGAKQYEEVGMGYDEMFRAMYSSYHEAADLNHALVADVGEAFYKSKDIDVLYASDGSHPSELGSQLAAKIIADVIRAGSDPNGPAGGKAE